MCGCCLFRNAESTYVVRTPKTEETNITVSMSTARPYFIFEVMTSSPILVYLATDLAHYRYAFHLGHNGNESRVIRYNWPQVETVLYTRSTPDILDGQEPRQFWISWQNGFLAAGRGKRLNQDTLLAFYDDVTRQVIPGIGLRSSQGWAEWTFDKSYGNGTFICIAC